MDDTGISSESSSVIQKFITSKKSGGKSPLTIKSYENFLVAYMLECKKPVSDIQRDDIINWYNKYSTGKETSTIRQRISILVTFFNFCVKRKIIEKSPMTKRMIKKARPGQYIKFLTNSETASLKRIAESLNIRDRCIFEFLVTSGVRRSELTKLNISDVNLDTRVATVLGKGNKGRPVSFSLETAYLLRGLIDNRSEDEPLFVNRYNQRVSDKHIWRVCCKLGKMSPIVRTVHPHVMRHTYARNFISNGKDLISLRRALGHSKVVTTMIYVDIPTEDLQRAYDKGMR